MSGARTVAIVGASLAGLRCAQELRGQGFDGRIAVVGDERHAPYDRPPLSKEFLAGGVEADSLALSEPDDADALEVDWHLGTRAVGLDAPARRVRLADGSEVAADGGVVIATGGTARALPGTAQIAGVYTLRSLDDAVALREALAAGSGRVVVVGAGLIGSEVASTSRALGHEVTVVEALAVPLVPVLGEAMGTACAGLHGDHGVTLRCGVGVAGLSTGGSPIRVTGVQLSDGTWLPADVVVTGIGMRPADGWLAGSAVDTANGVVCDSGGVTSVPGIVAAGDVARYRHPDTGRSVRHEHWTNAVDQPAVAVRNLLAGGTVAEYRPKGYFWSEQYGTRIQFTGTTEDSDRVEVVDGSVADRRFLAVYRRGETLLGALAMNNPKQFTRMRRTLAATQPAEQP